MLALLADALFLLNIASWGQVCAACALTGVALQAILGVSLTDAECGDSSLHRALAPYFASWALVATGFLLEVDRIAAVWGAPLLVE